MAEQSPRMTWPYPKADTDPWYSVFEDFVASMDASGYAAREDRNTIMAEGGTVSWVLGTETFAFTAAIILTAPITGFLWQPQPGSYVLTNGQVLYVTLPRGPGSNTAVTPVVANTVPSGDDTLVLALRINDRIYLRTGLVLSDGDSVSGVSPGSGGGGGSNLAISDEGNPLTAAAVSIDFAGAGVTASAVGTAVTVTVPGAAVVAQQDAYDAGALINLSDANGPLEVRDTNQTAASDGISARKDTTDGNAVYARNELAGATNYAIFASGKSVLVAPSAVQAGDTGLVLAPARTETQGARTITLPFGVLDGFAPIGGDFALVMVDGDPNGNVTAGDPGSLGVNPATGTIYKKVSNPSTWSEFGAAAPLEVVQAVNGTVLGTTPTLVGSVYLPAGTILSVSSRVMLGTDQVADTATLEIRRFTGGAVAGTITATGVLQDAQPGGDITIPDEDWYDLYLKSDVITTNAVLRGLKFVYVADPQLAIKQAFNQAVTGVTPTLVGSIYLPTGTLQTTSKAMMGTLAGGTATLELRRFTGGAVIATWAAIGALQSKVLGASPAIPADDWYDLYLYGDAAPTVAAIKGLDWTVLA